MPNYRLLTQVDAGDPLGSGLGARKPRPDEIAKRDAEFAAKRAAEIKADVFEKYVHATEKQMRESGRASGSAPLGNSGYAVGTPSKLDRVINCGILAATAERMMTNYLVQAQVADKPHRVMDEWAKYLEESAVATMSECIYGTTTGRISSDDPAPIVQKPKAEHRWPDDFQREIDDPGCDLLAVFCDHFGVEVKEDPIITLARFAKMTPRQYLTALLPTGQKSEDKVWFHLPGGRKDFLRKKVKPRDRNWVTQNTWMDEQGFLHKVPSPLGQWIDVER